MPFYTEHDFRKDWVAAKKAAKLSDKLFTLKFGPKLDAQNKLYKQVMEASPAKFMALYKKHGEKAVELKGIVKAYRELVNANGKNAQALKVLASIDANKKGCMIWDMALDKGSEYQSRKAQRQF